MKFADEHDRRKVEIEDAMIEAAEAAEEQAFANAKNKPNESKPSPLPHEHDV
jgi:hypothetical protein